MSDEELRELVADLTRSQKETDRRLAVLQEETWKQIRENGKLIGGLDNKFGSFTEGMALPSMEKVLAEHFGMDTIMPRIRKYRNGVQLEIDVLGYVNGDLNRAVVVEIKSHLREDGIQQMLSILERFPTFYPEHADKELVGVLAVVDAPHELRTRVLAEGLYLARIHDEVFTLDVPEGFQHHDFAQVVA